MGWLDPGFFVYSDETDFCKRLHDAGWRILFAPGARAIHHDQLSTDAAAMRRRIVEFHRGRDRYLRRTCRPSRGCSGRDAGRGPISSARPRRRCFPGRDPARYLLHARQQLRPGRGEGLREAAEARNRSEPPRRAPAPTERYAGGGPLRCPRRWSTRTSPNSQRSAAPSAPRSCSWHATGGAPGRPRDPRGGRGGPGRSLGNEGLDKLSSAAGAAAALAGSRWWGSRPVPCAQAGAGPRARAACRAVPPAARVRQRQPLLRLRGHRRSPRPAAAALLRARRRGRSPRLARAPGRGGAPAPALPRSPRCGLLRLRLALPALGR